MKLTHSPLSGLMSLSIKKIGRGKIRIKIKDQLLLVPSRATSLGASRDLGSGRLWALKLPELGCKVRREGELQPLPSPVVEGTPQEGGGVRNVLWGYLWGVSWGQMRRQI